MQVKIKQRSQKLNSFEEIVKKAVDVKAKTAFRPCSFTRNINQHCLQGRRPSATKTSTQGQPMKDPQVEKPKPKSQEQKALAS